MIVTEEEAKTKRCQESYPAARQIGDGSQVNMLMTSGSGAYAITFDTAPRYCLGSGCMAWCWHEPSKWVGPQPTRFAEPDKWMGFCGKAGA